MRIFYFLFFIFLVKISSAQVVFTVEVMSDTMQIGDVNIYRLKVAHPENVTIRSIDLKPLQVDPISVMPEFQDSAFLSKPGNEAIMEDFLREMGVSRETIEIKNYGNWNSPDESMMLTGSEANWKTQNNGNQVLKENDIQFTYWEEGMHTILSPIIEYEQNGSLQTITAKDELAILVGSPLAQESTPIDSMTVEPIKNVREEPIDFVQDILIPASLFILGFLIIGGLIYYFVKRGNQPKIDIPKPKEFVPANVIAINQLEELKGKQLWQNGDIKTYQSELTHIIRAYLENRYKINALEHTTNQIGLDLKKLNLKESLRTEVQNILQVADLVKFAKAKPTDDIHEQFMNKAHEFVESTKKDDAEIFAEKSVLENEYLEKVNQLTNSNTVDHPFRTLRFFANFFDLIVYFILYFAPFMLLVIAGKNLNFSTDFVSGKVNTIATLSVAILTFAYYYGYMESKKGYTLGKKILGIRIQNIDGSNISFLKSCLRFILKIISNALLGLPYLTIFFTKKKQTLYDIILKTEIVKIPKNDRL